VSGTELTFIVYKMPAVKSENVPAKQKYMMKNCTIQIHIACNEALQSQSSLRSFHENLLTFKHSIRNPLIQEHFFLCPTYHINNLQLFPNTSLTNVFFRLTNSMTFTSQQYEPLHMHKHISWPHDLLKQNFVA